MGRTLKGERMSAKTIKSRQEFDGEIGSGAKRLALFYSAWCPFCLAFMPDFEKQAAAEPGTFLKICTDELEELEDVFSIDVVPTVLCFEGGKLSRRLDGKLGRGLSAADLASFAACCAPRKGNK